MTKIETNSPMFVISNQTASVVILLVSLISILTALVMLTPTVISDGLWAKKQIIGVFFLFLLALVLIHNLIFKMPVVKFYSDKLIIKSLYKKESISWNEVEDYYFSKHEIEYKIINSKSPALVFELKDGNRRIMLFSQKKKSKLAKQFATDFQIKDGSLVKN